MPGDILGRNAYIDFTVRKLDRSLALLLLLLCMRPIIKVENLSKQYGIGARQPAYSTLRDSITEKLRAPFDWLRRNGSKEDNTIWALKDVSFEVMPGEVVGVIGHNGAG